MHRLDGSAVEYANGTKHWYIEGKEYTEEEYNNKMQELSKIEVKKLENKTEYYYKGELHRDDGPAIELKNGDKFWYQNGKLHRVDGPAVENINGSKF